MARNPRRKSRELAFQALYSASFAPPMEPAQLEQVILSAPRENGQEQDLADPLACELAKGVTSHEAELDAAIKRFSKNWRTERIGRIELLLLRLALFELLYKDTPPRVVISEILDMAGDFGVEDARPFLNGILDAAARSAGTPAGAQLSHSET